jgi:ABC-2 type transport system permease protein
VSDVARYTGERHDDQARILDRSYRSYDGERGGVRAAVFSTGKHSVQRALGLKRTIWQKILPFVSIIIAFVPAIVFVGLAALIPADQRPDDLLPTYAEYYGYITAAIVIFTAFVAPEVLCTDRRTGMLGLYLASPLDRNTYLVAKAAAVGFVLSIVTIGPLLLMLIANTIIGDGPDNPLDWIVALARVVAGGCAISALHTALSLAVSSFTSRRAAASATIVIVLIASNIVVSVLVFGAGWSGNLRAFNLFLLPFDFVTRIFGETLGEPEVDNVSTALIAAANVGWTILFAATAWYRYRKITVTR